MPTHDTKKSFDKILSRLRKIANTQGSTYIDNDTCDHEDLEKRISTLERKEITIRINTLPPLNPTTLTHAARLSMLNNVPVIMKYYIPSVDCEVYIGIDNNLNEKYLVRSSEDYTKPIKKIYKSCSEYIVATDQGIYIISDKTQQRKISVMNTE